MEHAEMVCRVALQEQTETKPQGKAKRTRAAVPTAMPR